ncbi:hypothetical protein [Virgibacillus necropolis]|nr:hypothetical protein [Virgibacillus necropolis]
MKQKLKGTIDFTIYFEPTYTYNNIHKITIDQTIDYRLEYSVL